MSVFSFKGKYARLKFSLYIAAPYIVIYSIFSVSNKSEYRHPHIKAPTFSWPAGCPKIDYPLTGEISRACVVNALPMSIPKKFGLSMVRSNPYYRIGNDMIEIQCNYRSEYCFILNNEKRSFHQ